MGSLRLPAYNLAEDLRLNLDDFSESDRLAFEGFVETSQSKKMDSIAPHRRCCRRVSLNSSTHGARHAAHISAAA
jgi:hypothetical protein